MFTFPKAVLSGTVMSKRDCVREETENKVPDECLISMWKVILRVESKKNLIKYEKMVERRNFIELQI